MDVKAWERRSWVSMGGAFGVCGINVFRPASLDFAEMLVERLCKYSSSPTYALHQVMMSFCFVGFSLTVYAKSHLPQRKHGNKAR